MIGGLGSDVGFIDYFAVDQVIGKPAWNEHVIQSQVWIPDADVCVAER